VKIKSYFADSVQAAIESARAELGSDAMLLNSKKTEVELRSLGAYEVVFGVASEASKTAEPEAPEPSSTDELVRSSEVVKELADLRRQIETVRRSVVRHGRGAAATGGQMAADADRIAARLLAADFSEELATELAETVARQVGSAQQGRAGRSGEREPWPPELVDAALASELEQRFSVAPHLGPAGAGTRIVLFAGPAGAGKTTCLIKLAIRHGLRARVPLQILSLDTLRVGGWEQLASYARIAGLAFEVVHTAGLLGQALAEFANKKLILIDTPGLSPAELRDTPELAQAASQAAHVEVQLVLPAVLRPQAALATIERFRAFQPSKLLFTHMDEMETPGGLLEVAIRSGLPVSFLSTGQQIPEDIREASKAELLGPLATLPALAALPASDLRPSRQLSVSAA
jgi:flagellar biosynthesis protein FlhF